MESKRVTIAVDTPPSFRQPFSDVVVQKLTEFTKTHLTKNRKEFQQMWSRWIVDNACLIDQEQTRLRNNGFAGDVLDKMYKSARNYLRKKIRRELSHERECRTNADADIGKKRKNRISTDKNIIALMHSHAKLLGGSDSRAWKPSEKFKCFMQTHGTQVREEIARCCNHGESKYECMFRIKSGYKTIARREANSNFIEGTAESNSHVVHNAVT